MAWTKRKTKYLFGVFLVLCGLVMLYIINHITTFSTILAALLFIAIWVIIATGIFFMSNNLYGSNEGKKND